MPYSTSAAAPRNQRRPHRVTNPALAGLNSEQTRVARKIIAEGQRLGVPRKVIKVALATSLVEANLMNPNYGDADSLGAFQQRPSQGWGSRAQVTNVRHAARSFYREAVPLFHRGVRGGELAQAVQRSAFPGRYGPRLAEAGHILSRLEGKIAPDAPTALAGRGSRGGRGFPTPSLADLAKLIPTSRQVSRAVGPAPSTRDVQAGIEAGAPSTQAPMAHAVLAGQRNARVSQLQSMQPATHSRTPFQGRTETVNEAIPGDVRKAMLAKLHAEVAAQAQQRPVRPQRGGRVPAGPGGFQGKVRISPSADRAGVSTRPIVINFVKQISALYGRPLEIGTGTNHSRMTTSGNVSDHWSGHAADIPATGAELLRLGRLALIAAGANRKWAKRQTGGLFNVNGHQIIFRTTIGGNHWNHLHVSA